MSNWGYFGVTDPLSMVSASYLDLRQNTTFFDDFCQGIWFLGVSLAKESVNCSLISNFYVFTMFFDVFYDISWFLGQVLVSNYDLQNMAEA